MHPPPASFPVCGIHPHICKAPGFLQFTVHLCISLPACCHVPSLVHSMGIGSGGGVDIEDAKSVSHQHACGAVSLDLVTESATVSSFSLCSLQARAWLPLMGPWRQLAYDLGFQGLLDFSDAWQAHPCSPSILSPSLVWRKLIIWIFSHSLSLGYL